MIPKFIYCKNEYILEIILISAIEVLDELERELPSFELPTMILGE